MRRGLLLALVLSTSGSAIACTDSAPAAKDPEPGKPPAAKPPTKPIDPDPVAATPEVAPDELVESLSLPPVDGFFMAKGAPQPRACSIAKDCKGDTIPDLDNPCCQNPRSLEPYAWAYQTWLNGWRTEHCKAVVCPPPPNPSQPPACAFDNDCVDGVCVDACDP